MQQKTVTRRETVTRRRTAMRQNKMIITALAAALIAISMVFSSSAADKKEGTRHKQDGTWFEDRCGWQYSYSDGTQPREQWALLEWQNATDWYYFGADGYLVTGWFTDTDGNRYFLHNAADGTKGYMYTGWHEIGGKWYYFNRKVGGPLGALVVNTETPDGHFVGEDGARIR